MDLIPHAKRTKVKRPRRVDSCKTELLCSSAPRQERPRRLRGAARPKGMSSDIVRPLGGASAQPTKGSPLAAGHLPARGRTSPRPRPQNPAASPQQRPAPPAAALRCGHLASLPSTSQHLAAGHLASLPATSPQQRLAPAAWAGGTAPRPGCTGPRAPTLRGRCTASGGSPRSGL